MIQDPILYAHNPKQHIKKDNHNTQDNPYHIIIDI